MKRNSILWVFLLVFCFIDVAKAQTTDADNKASVCLTFQAENGSVYQKNNADGTITCIISPDDVMRVLSIFLNGEDITGQLENNKLTLPILTQNTTLEVNFENKPFANKTNYKTIAIY